LRKLGVDNERKIEFLSKVPFFSGLPKLVLEELALNSRFVSYRKGTDIFLEGDPPIGMFVVAEGVVKIYKYSQEGREQVLTVEKPPGLIAELPLFDGLPYPANAVAQEDTKVLLVPREAFESLLKRHPELALTIIKNISLRLRRLVTLIEEISFLEIPQRLARYLLSSSEGKDEFTIPHTNAEIASIIGTVRELVSRNLARLSQEGIIELKGKDVRILNRAKLEEISKG